VGEELAAVAAVAAVAAAVAVAVAVAVVVESLRFLLDEFSGRC
jgi:hypothetical protein